MRDKHRLLMTRKRAHSLLLSQEGYRLGKISDILGVCSISVSSWLEAWKKDGLVGFYAKKRTGRPRTLSLLVRKRSHGVSRLSPKKTENRIGRHHSSNREKNKFKNLKANLQKSRFKMETNPKNAQTKER